jgi:hypothetical protein
MEKKKKINWWHKACKPVARTPETTCGPRVQQMWFMPHARVDAGKTIHMHGSCYSYANDFIVMQQ